MAAAAAIGHCPASPLHTAMAANARVITLKSAVSGTRRVYAASSASELLVERLFALAFVLAVALALLLLEQVVVVRAVFLDGAHGPVMPGTRRYNPRRSPGAWRNW